MSENWEGRDKDKEWEEAVKADIYGVYTDVMQMHAPNVPVRMNMKVEGERSMDRPRPWSIGECHESMAQICDASGRHFATINTMIGDDPIALAELFIMKAEAIVTREAICGNVAEFEESISNLHRALDAERRQVAMLRENFEAVRHERNELHEQLKRQRRT